MLIETHDTAMLLNELAIVRGQLEQFKVILRNTKHVLERIEHTDPGNVNCKACMLYQDVVKALGESKAELERKFNPA